MLTYSRLMDEKGNLVYQVCNNMLDSNDIKQAANAIKFTKQGGNIFVKIYNRENSIVISIKDTGIGIPKNKHKIIFERLRQVEQSLVRSHEGSGIGLSLAKSLVEMHEGKIHVESEEGSGSEFIIELPIKELPADESGQKEYTYDINNNSNIDKLNIEFSDISLPN